MKLPKYETFSIVGIINVILGAYIYKYLTSIGIGYFRSCLALIVYYIIIIMLYENLRKD